MVNWSKNSEYVRSLYPTNQNLYEMKSNITQHFPKCFSNPLSVGTLPLTSKIACCLTE